LVVLYSGLYHLEVGVALVLGIDGGGSRTTAAVAIGSNVIAMASVGPSNVRTYGADAAVAVIESVVIEALREAGLAAPSICAVVAGLAGVSRRKERAPVEAWLARFFAGRPARLVTDVELILAAGLHGGDGVAVVSGTGSIVFGRNAGGTARSGGWGPTVGDPGSGYAIGRAALLATAEALDGMVPSGPLSELIVARTGVLSADELGAGQGPSEIAALAPVVTDAAASGDSVAVAILEAAGRDLALQVVAVLRRLQWVGPVQLALGGSVMVHVPAIREALVRDVEAAGWALQTPTVVHHPVLAATALAQDLLELAASAP
jgi:N-acetylmuramic acid 6-phosphate etherase